METTNAIDVSEELFCLRFELNSLAEVLIKQQSERWLAGFSPTFVERDHLERYYLASIYVHQKRVLDIACGAGKGSQILAQRGKAHRVLGGDIHLDALRYANWRNRSPNVEFRYIDALTPQLDQSFQVIVSFETIEHLPQPETFLKNAAALLEPAGHFVVSTPISKQGVDTRPQNPYHLIEWGFREFQQLVSRYFLIEQIHVQLYPKKLGPPPPRDLYDRILRKLKLRPLPYPDQPPFVSTLERYIDQYPTTEMGTERIGYQILICRPIS